MTPHDAAMPILLMSAFRGLVDTVHAELEEAGFRGVRVTHGFAMQAIGQGCSSVELAARLGVSKQAATKTAKALEDLGFVTRSPGLTDRRERILRPTPRGVDVLGLSAESFARQVRRWRQQVGDEHVDMTLETLARADPGRKGPADISDWT